MDYFRSEREGVRLMNPHIQDMEEDVLYHLALGSGSHDLQQMFGDVKFVCMGGTPQRMKSFAEYMLSQLGYMLPTGTCLVDISERSHRLVATSFPSMSCNIISFQSQGMQCIKLVLYFQSLMAWEYPRLGFFCMKSLN